VGIMSSLPPELKALLLEERRRAMEAAATFARVCQDGPADHLYNAHLLLNESGPRCVAICYGTGCEITACEPRDSGRLRLNLG
jgi:hypothetical protein